MNDIDFVAGPGESPQSFAERIEASRALRASLLQSDLALPFLDAPELEDNEQQAALDAVEQAYGVRPGWVPVYLTSRGLSPWQGGASWILQLDQPDVPVVAIQLRKRVWGLYSRQELLQHELVHAGRVAFEEPIFEEFFAYRLSSSVLRRVLGPAFQTPREAVVFLGAFLVAAVLGVFYPLAWLAPGLLCLFGLLRLRRRHRQVALCVHKLEQAFTQCRAWHIAYRLTDSEIITFARSSTEELRRFVHEQKCLRWQQILAVDPALSGIA